MCILRFGAGFTNLIIQINSFFFTKISRAHLKICRFNLPSMEVIVVDILFIFILVNLYKTILCKRKREQRLYLYGHYQYINWTQT